MPKDGISCNWCGYVNASVAEAPPPPVPAPVAAIPEKPAEDSLVPLDEKAPLHRWADDEDDDGQPYRIPKSEIRTRRCEQCAKEVELKAVVCVHCGFDSEKKAKAERTFQPIDREWESGWPFQKRMTGFLICQSINLVTLIISIAFDNSASVSILSLLFTIGLQAFLFGTYDRVRIRRNKKGQAEIFVTWRIGFIPRTPQKINWKEHEGVVFGHYDPTGLSDWWIFFVLLPMCVLPSILWWWFVIRSDRYFAALARDRGFPETYLYRGLNEQQAKEIAQIATDATGLPLANPL